MDRRQTLGRYERRKEDIALEKKKTYLPENREEKLGTHCAICGERMSGEHPGADVYHMDCLMAATKHLREKNDESEPISKDPFVPSKG